MADDLSRMDEVSGGLGEWDNKKKAVDTKVYVDEVQMALASCLMDLGTAFDEITKNPTPSGTTTAKLGMANLGVMKLGQS